MFVNKLFIVIISLILVNGLTDEGRWDADLSGDGEASQFQVVSRTLYQNAQMNMKLNCHAARVDKDIYINLNIVVMQSPCLDYTDTMKTAKDIFTGVEKNHSLALYYFSNSYKCADHIQLQDSELGEKKSLFPDSHPFYMVPKDGIYVLAFEISSNGTYQMAVKYEIKNEHGYLAAKDYPLLNFYLVMCIYYVLLGLLWLVLSFLQWRDLLRVQFWIGGVILLGMLEKATFYSEYQVINSTGNKVQGAVLFAEWTSCAKRTLARMLVIIVSLGFGIVKPRLGATLHRVVGVGLLYFLLAASESYMRITKENSYPSRDLYIAGVPLAVLDSAICWWIFSALVNTTRTLRLRRNEIKLALYRHFTNTLIFAVIASIFFMLYGIKAHRFIKCLKTWKDLWIEDAYWHVLFSGLLLVIIILWRPTNNNQRYAFVPLLDTGDDDDEEEERLVSDAYGVKVRVHKSSTTPPQSRNSVDDDLKWLEENVHSERALPILDSDEELVNTRFEVSKMQ